MQAPPADRQSLHSALTWGLAALILGLLLMPLAATLLLRQFDEDHRLRDSVEQSYRSRAEIQTTLSLLQDMETGQRGYLLTGNQAFLEPYHAARKALPLTVQKLRYALDGEDPQGRDSAAVVELIRTRIAFLDHGIRLQSSGRAEEAARFVAAGGGKRAMDLLRARLGSLAKQQENDLRSAVASADDARLQTRRLTLGLQAVGILFLAIAGAIAIGATIRRRRAMAQLARYAARQEAIFASASDGMIIHDAAGIIESLNPALARIHGYEPRELIGKSVVDLMPQEQREKIGPAIAELIELDGDAPPTTFQTLALRKDGSTRPVEVVVSPVPLAEGERFLAVVRDVSERERIERMKNEFVSTVSHELRTPLTSIAGSLGLLAGGAAGPLPERAGKLIDIAHSNSNRLVRLINDILDIEKIESGKMAFDIRPMPLRPLLEQAVAGNRAFADEYGVKLQLEAGEKDAAVLADPDRLMQVLTNLISNAVKFSPRGEKVTISAARHRDGYRIAVADRGPGIPDDFRSRIFSKFAQADSSDTRAKGGTGLGLSIVREIMVRLGGKISFESEEGKGSRFFADLPAATPRQAAKGDLVLLCEGDDEGARAVKQTLERAGFPCDIATSDEELKRLTGDKDYAVLILDLPLPGQEMISLIQDLRATVRYAGTPILVVSTEAARGEISQAVDIADWMPKPVAIERLVEGVRSVVGDGGRPRILHVDDDLDVLRVVASAFEGRANLTPVTGLDEAREMLKSRDFDLVILDLALPGGSGAELLPDMRNSLGQPVPVVIFSAHESEAELARRVEAALVKSRASLDHLVQTVEMLVDRSLRHRRSREMEG